MPLRMRLFLFLSTPAHLWMWICAKLCGMGMIAVVQKVPEDEDDG